jgi:hypothetical protein
MSKVGSLVNSVFGIQKLSPTPVPTAPSNDPAAEQAQRDAANAAIAERAASGRRSTIAAGASIAADEQYTKGLLSQTKRSQMSTALGL